MEEKRHEVEDRIRSISGFRHVRKLFPFRSYISPNHGFSLIEILVVVAILGILLTGLIAMIDPVKQIQKSEDSKLKSDMKQLQAGLELYRSDCGAYPVAPSSNELPSPLISTCTGADTTYIQSVPKTPTGANYYYQNISNTQRYEISACLQNKDDMGEGTFAHPVCPSGRAFRVNNP